MCSTVQYYSDSCALKCVSNRFASPHCAFMNSLAIHSVYGFCKIPLHSIIHAYLFLIQYFVIKASCIMNIPLYAYTKTP